MSGPSQSFTEYQQFNFARIINTSKEKLTPLLPKQFQTPGIPGWTKMKYHIEIQNYG